MNNVKYDPQIIYEFANDLYAQANWIILKYSLTGFLLGGGVSYFIQNNQIISIVSAVILGVLAMSIGKSRAYSLKLQAQTALCQVQIEKNTRSGLDKNLKDMDLDDLEEWRISGKR